MIGIIFLFVLRIKKGKQEGIWVVLGETWLQGPSESCYIHWHVDTEITPNIFRHFLPCDFFYMCGDLLDSQRQVPNIAPVPNHTPLSLKIMWMAGTETCPGRHIREVLFHNKSCLEKEKGAFYNILCLSEVFFFILKLLTWILKQAWFLSVLSLYPQPQYFM